MATRTPACNPLAQLCLPKQLDELVPRQACILDKLQCQAPTQVAIVPGNDDAKPICRSSEHNMTSCLVIDLES